MPQAIRGNQRTDLESSLGLKSDSVVLVNHLSVSGMWEVIRSIYQFAWPYSSYQYLEQSSLLSQYKPSPASHWIRALSRPITMTSQNPHHFSYCPQCMHSTRETKWFPEAVSKEKLGAREWVPEVVKLAEHFSSFTCFMSKIGHAGLQGFIPSSKASFPYYIAYTAGLLTNTSNPVLLKKPEFSQKDKENKWKLHFISRAQL